MKRCTKCGIDKPLTEFYAAKGTRDGLRGDCKACFRSRAKARYPEVRDQAIARARKWREDNIERFRENQRRMRSTPEGRERQRRYHLLSTFGLTLEEYDEMLAAQGGVCQLCGRPPTEGISLHIDHNHETGDIRGLLCFRCNNALGDFDDSPERLMSAVAYLLSYETAEQWAERERRQTATIEAFA